MLPPSLGPKSKFSYNLEENRKPLPPKRLYLSTNVHEVLSQKKIILIIVLYSTQNPTKERGAFFNYLLRHWKHCRSHLRILRCRHNIFTRGRIFNTQKSCSFYFRQMNILTTDIFSLLRNVQKGYGAHPGSHSTCTGFLE